MFLSSARGFKAEEKNEGLFKQQIIGHFYAVKLL